MILTDTGYLFTLQHALSTATARTYNAIRH